MSANYVGLGYRVRTPRKFFRGLATSDGVQRTVKEHHTLENIRHLTRGP